MTGEVVRSVKLVADTGYAPQVTAAFSNHQLTPHTLLHVLRHIAMDQVGLVVSRNNECTCFAMTARYLDMEHASRVQVLRQTMNHPLVTDGIVVHEGHFDTTARQYADLVLAHTKNHPRNIVGILSTRMNGQIIFLANAGTITWKLIGIFVHHHAIDSQRHLVSLVSGMINNILTGHRQRQEQHEISKQYGTGLQGLPRRRVMVSSMANMMPSATDSTSTRSNMNQSKPGSENRPGA